MNQASASVVAVRRITVASIVAIAIGAIVAILGIGLDWQGFLGGMALGAGIGLVVVGAYFWGYANGVRRGGSRAMWLPGRDADS
ncbi:hypothetical protein [Agromyces sp. NPDC058110]|uniref:hypothetical protein n=1 Tax=Agromyces sp. NPDC058110 TaxID=3346345 RepID=UPI0036DDAAD2